MDAGGSRVKTTRLRYIKAKDPNLIVEFLNRLGVRVRVYGSPQWNGKSWFCWFVPDDRGADIKSVDLDA